MEFPNLGQHCQVKSCNRLDFLPMKCDACSNVFCCDHYTYSQHSCKKGYQKDVQVPVCPLCNNPVPSKRREQPDIAVSEHIDRDCQADPAIAKRKIYTNKCGVKGCKQKEIIRIMCDGCHKSYCLKHRHPVDHKCHELKAVPPAQAAGAAAMARAQNVRNSRYNWFSSQSSSSKDDRDPVPSLLPDVSIDSVHGGLTEDEALALALHKSMNETKPKFIGKNLVLPRSMKSKKRVQEEEDRRLAMALANSDEDRDIATSRNQQTRDRSCLMS